MKIFFDIDGTLTDFEGFILKHRNYIEKKYGFSITNKKGYDIDEMFELKEKFFDQGFSKEVSKAKSEKILNEFWYKYYFNYCVMTKFRKGVKETLNKLKESGYEIIIVSSRKKTCDKSFIGKLVKYSTILKFKFNRINYNEIVFFENDEEKMKYLKKQDRDSIKVDDKPEIIDELSTYSKCICVSSSYNDKNFNENVCKIQSFENDEVINQVDEIIKRESSLDSISNLQLYSGIKKTERFYKIIKAIGTPFVKIAFKPIILNKQNISSEKPLIYAPNHRKTLDPFFIVLSSDDAIHWAALKRFFTGEDSIFNNSKNHFLCFLTSKIFEGIGAVPVDRGGDTTEMTNTINYYLSNSSNVGIFPEGTTNKHPNEKKLLEIKSGILHFAKDNHALIQPVSIYWTTNNPKNKVVINYGKAFSMDNLTIDEGKEKWNNEILDCLSQCEKYDEENKTLKLKY